LYGLSFKTTKKKWAWAQKKNLKNFSGENDVDLANTAIYPFKFEEQDVSLKSVVNTLPKTLRSLAPIRREFGFRLRSKQAAKAA
jgi:hypothetical protein